MKIYVDRGGTAPSPRRLRMYLAEKGIEVPYAGLEIHVENRTPEFREKNAASTLPLLELDDGTCISESLAICRYFEELHPEPPLFGSTPVERARVEMWTRRAELFLYLPIDFTGAFEGEAGATWRGHANRALRFLDRSLADRRHVVGERLTIADIVAYGAIDYGLTFHDFSIAPEHENLARWFAEVGSRPSAKA